MHRSLNHIKNFITRAESADPHIRKKQLFGGDAQKEQIFKNNQQKLQLSLNKKVYNQSASKFQLVSFMMTMMINPI